MNGSKLCFYCDSAKIVKNGRTYYGKQRYRAGANHIERFFCTLRQRANRMARKSFSFSKKLERHIKCLKIFCRSIQLIITFIGLPKYAHYALDWIQKRASIVGGYCELGPTYNQYLKYELLKEGHQIVSLH